MLLADSLAGGQKQYAEEICSQTLRLNRMIEGFLDIARIESGKYTFRQFPFDVLSVIQEGILAVSYAAEQKQVIL